MSCQQSARARRGGLLAAWACATLALGACQFASVAPTATGPLPSNVPAKYRSAYSAVVADLDGFRQALGTHCSTPHRPNMFAELLPANLNRTTELLKPGAVQGALLYATRLKELGVSGVTMNVGYPVLLPDYPQYAAYLSFFKQVVRGVRQMHLRVAIELGLLIPGFSKSRISYSHLTLAKFASAEEAIARTTIRDLKPDILQIAEEPSVLKIVTGLTDFDNNPDAFAKYASDMDAAVKALAASNGVKLTAGIGNWERYEYRVALLKRLTTDYVDVHIYNPEQLRYAVVLIDRALKLGKRVTVTETWLDKGGAGFTQQYGDGIKGAIALADLDALSFWSPLDSLYFQLLARLQACRSVDMVSLFWANYLFAYADYGPSTADLTSGAAKDKAAENAAKAIIADRISPSGEALRRLLTGGPTR